MAGTGSDLYSKYHSSRQDERLGLFRGLVERYGVSSALYPGCFVHVTPSFVIPRVVYMDTDARAARFFSGPAALGLVCSEREYAADPQVTFHRGDYTAPIAEDDEAFDLLISQYAGFVSRACKRHLLVGGHLVANNSHGDASMAALDPDFDLVAVYGRRGETFTFTSDELETYMRPKRGVAPSQADLERTRTGPAFTRAAAGYVFRRTG